MDYFLNRYQRNFVVCLCHFNTWILIQQPTIHGYFSGTSDNNFRKWAALDFFQTYDEILVQFTFNHQFEFRRNRFANDLGFIVFGVFHLFRFLFLRLLFLSFFFIILAILNVILFSWINFFLLEQSSASILCSNQMIYCCLLWWFTKNIWLIASEDICRSKNFLIWFRK